MNASKDLVDLLQNALELHWCAIETYRCQAAHFRRHGYGKLADELKHEAEEEGEHAERLIYRLEEFDVAPSCACDCQDHPRLPDIQNLLRFNLDIERETCELERAGITLARTSKDEKTARILELNLNETEEAIVRIEAQLRQIDVCGVDQWLSAKL